MKNLRGLLLPFLILVLGISDFPQAQDQQGTPFLFQDFKSKTLQTLNIFLNNYFLSSCSDQVSSIWIADYKPMSLLIPNQ